MQDANSVIKRAEAWNKDNSQTDMMANPDLCDEAKEHITDLLALADDMLRHIETMEEVNKALKAEVKTSKERAIRIHDCHRSDLCSNCRSLIKQMTGEENG